MPDTFFDDIHSTTIPDLLKKLRGQEVTLMLSTGNSISGTLPDRDIAYGSQFTRMVHLTRLTGHEHEDAVFALDMIRGIILRRP